MCICVCIHIYIYIYIYRERERERYGELVVWQPSVISELVNLQLISFP